MFLRNLLSPSSGSNKQQESSSGSPPPSLPTFRLEDGGSTFHLTIGKHPPGYTARHPGEIIVKIPAVGRIIASNQYLGTHNLAHRN
jgi:hypothetical protein